MGKPNKSAKVDAPTLAERYLRRLASGKKGYKDSDEAMDALEKILRPGKIVTLASGKKFALIDKWKHKTKANYGGNVRRFDLQPVEN